MIAAKNAHAASDTAATPSASGSQNRTPYSCAESSRPAPTASGSPSARPTTHATERAVQHHLDHLAAIGAERHPDADLVRALRDACTRSRRKGRSRRAPARRCRTARRGSPRRAADRTSDRPAAAASGRSCTVRFGSASASARFTSGSSVPGGVLVTSSSPRTKCDCDLETLHQRIGVVDGLRERHEEHRPRRPIELRSPRTSHRARCRRSGRCRRSPAGRGRSADRADPRRS